MLEPVRVRSPVRPVRPVQVSARWFLNASIHSSRSRPEFHFPFSPLNYFTPPFFPSATPLVFLRSCYQQLPIPPTPRTLVNDLPLVNLFLVPWQCELLPGPLALEGPFKFNLADAFAPIAFMGFSDFDNLEDVFLFDYE